MNKMKLLIGIIAWEGISSTANAADISDWVYNDDNMKTVAEQLTYKDGAWGVILSKLKETKSSDAVAEGLANNTSALETLAGAYKTNSNAAALMREALGLTGGSGGTGTGSGFTEQEIGQLRDFLEQNVDIDELKKQIETLDAANNQNQTNIVNLQENKADKSDLDSTNEKLELLQATGEKLTDSVEQNTVDIVNLQDTKADKSDLDDTKKELEALQTAGEKLNNNVEENSDKIAEQKEVISKHDESIQDLYANKTDKNDFDNLSSLINDIDSGKSEEINEVRETVGDVSELNATHYAPSATNVSDAVKSIDSKVYQLDQNIYRLNHDLAKVRHEMRGGLASLAAMSALVPNARATGNTQISFGTGTYHGKSAVAVGGFHWVNDNVLLNAGVSLGNDSDAAYRMGVTYSW